MYAFANDQGGAVEQWRLDADGSGMSGTRVRSWAVGSAPPEERVAVDRVGVGEPEGGHLASNVEGLSIYAPRVGGPDDGFLVASSQGNHTYVVYDRAPPHAYRGTFRVGEAGAVDGVEDTDGLHVVLAPVGPRYPIGLLVVQGWDQRGPGRAGQPELQARFVAGCARRPQPRRSRRS